MLQFKSALYARKLLSKARYEMACSDSDTFRIETDYKRATGKAYYIIAMYSSNNTFCGYY